MSLVVMVTLPVAGASELARTLVERRLAAAVNVVGGLQSFYRWEEEVVEEPEAMLIIKTNGEQYPELEKFIRERHPYEVPEILALQVDRALPEFSSWLSQSVGKR